MAERLSLKESVGPPPGGFPREVTAWLGYSGRKGHSEQPRHGPIVATPKTIDSVELDYELAVALANVTEGAARATVLEVTQAEPSHGFVAWQALVDGCAPKSSSDPAIALQPVLATPKRCKDAKELKERLTAWSLKVAEYEQHSW